MLDERKNMRSIQREIVNDDALELERMVSESNESKSNEQKGVAEKTDNKVYVKTANNSEGGYGSVQKGVYTSGPSVYYVYGFSIFLELLWIFWMIKKLDRVKEKKFLPMFAFMF